MSSYKISIPKPCTEDWDQMTQTDKGKLCASCKKVVIDFTGKSNQEIMEILVENKGKKVCGNFFNTQIERPMVYLPKTKSLKWPAIAAMLVAGMFQLNIHAFGQQNSWIASNHKQVVHHRELSMKGEPETEPASKDSVVSYKVKLYDSKTKLPIAGGIVYVAGFGQFTTNQSGIALVTIPADSIPETFTVDLTANGYAWQQHIFTKAKLATSNKMELPMVEEDKYMLRGDVSIEESK